MSTLDNTASAALDDTAATVVDLVLSYQGMGVGSPHDAVRAEIEKVVQFAVKKAEQEAADRVRAELLGPPCDHDWSNRGTPGDQWQECWLCGTTRNVEG